jgi:hypothetical protein
VVLPPTVWPISGRSTSIFFAFFYASFTLFDGRRFHSVFILTFPAQLLFSMSCCLHRYSSNKGSTPPDKPVQAICGFPRRLLCSVLHHTHKQKQASLLLVFSPLPPPNHVLRRTNQGLTGMYTKHKTIYKVYICIYMYVGGYASNIFSSLGAEGKTKE